MYGSAQGIRRSSNPVAAKLKHDSAANYIGASVVESVLLETCQNVSLCNFACFGPGCVCCIGPGLMGASALVFYSLPAGAFAGIQSAELIRRPSLAALYFPHPCDICIFLCIPFYRPGALTAHREGFIFNKVIPQHGLSTCRAAAGM